MLDWFSAVMYCHVHVTVFARHYFPYFDLSQQVNLVSAATTTLPQHLAPNHKSSLSLSHDTMIKY